MKWPVENRAPKKKSPSAVAPGLSLGNRIQGIMLASAYRQHLQRLASHAVLQCCIAATAQKIKGADRSRRSHRLNLLDSADPEATHKESPT